MKVAKSRVFNEKVRTFRSTREISRLRSGNGEYL